MGPWEKVFLLLIFFLSTFKEPLEQKSFAASKMNIQNDPEVFTEFFTAFILLNKKDKNSKKKSLTR